MKKLSITLIGIVAFLSYSCQETENSTADEPSPFHDGINWQGENEIANYLAIRGIGYFMNIEREKAYVLFEQAIKIDSSLFASHTALALMSRGEKRDFHKKMASKFVEGENEVSHFFVSLLEIARDSLAADKRREVWANMHELSNGPFIHFQYAISRADTLEAIEELGKLESILSELNYNTAHIHNVRGYFFNLNGDLSKGINEIEEYMKMYPSGYNPLDSRAEFYLFSGDTVKAIEYYKKAIEKFPFATSARNTLNDLTEE